MAQLDGHNGTGGGSIDRYDDWARLTDRFSAEYSKVGEYGTVVLLHRWIDTTVTKAIQVQFAPGTKTASSRLFKYPGGLSSFSARVHLARCFNLFGSVTYGDLKIINDIRNEFAHPSEEHVDGMEVLGFNNPQINELCKKLQFLNNSEMPPPNYRRLKGEQRLFNTAKQIAIGIWIVHLTEMRHSSTWDDFRNRTLP